MRDSFRSNVTNVLRESYLFSARTFCWWQSKASSIEHRTSSPHLQMWICTMNFWNCWR